MSFNVDTNGVCRNVGASGCVEYAAHDGTVRAWPLFPGFMVNVPTIEPFFDVSRL